MKLHMTTLLAGAALVVTVAVCAEAGRSNEAAQSNPFVTDTDSRSFTVSGTIVAVRSGTVVVRIDDHGHHIPFSLGPGVAASDLRAGKRVTVRYHPLGSTGQRADEIR